MIRVLIADDQRVVRDGLTLLLGLIPHIEVVSAADDGADALAMAEQRQPDVVLMDLRMPRCDGIEATRALCERKPDVRVVVLTTYADDRSVLDALRAGARGYLTKNAGVDEIRSALETVMSGRAMIDPSVQHHLVDTIVGVPGDAAAEPLPDGLTRREAEVLALIADGLSNAEIAARLVLSAATVKSHVNHLLPKIGARDRAQAVRYAYQKGLAAAAE